LREPKACDEIIQKHYSHYRIVCGDRLVAIVSIEMAIVVLKSVPEYDENKDFFNAKLAEFHERAFGMAHKRGRFESSFGETIYRTVLLKQFMNDAEAAGNTPVVEAMQRELQKIEQSTSDH